MRRKKEKKLHSPKVIFQRKKEKNCQKEREREMPKKETSEVVENIK